MGDLAPMLGYYIFLIFILFFGLFIHYGLNYLRKKKEEKDKIK